MIEDFLEGEYAVQQRLPDIGFGRECFLLVGRSAEKEGKTFVLDVATHVAPLRLSNVNRQRSLADKMGEAPLRELCAIVKSRFLANWQAVISEHPGTSALRQIPLQGRKVSPEQATHLLAHLSRAIDAATRFGWPRLAIDSRRIFVHADSGSLRFPTPELPTFEASGDGAPFAKTDASNATELPSVDPLQTIAFSTKPNPSYQRKGIPFSSWDYVPELALLLCELLGEPQGRNLGGGHRFKPVENLGPNRNAALQSALQQDAGPSNRNVLDFFEAYAGRPLATFPVRSLSELAVAAGPGQLADEAAAASLSDIPLPSEYQLESDLLNNPFVRSCYARDSSGESVLLTVLAPDIAADVEMKRLGKCLRDFRKIDSERLVPVCDASLGRPLTYVARTVCAGANLSEVVRRQGRLTKEQVSLVLGGLHRAYQEFWQAEPGLVASSLHQIALSPAPPVSQDWPPTLSVELDGGEVLLTGARFSDESQLLRHFAIIAGRLLGLADGDLSRNCAYRFTPIPELSDEDNDLLCQVATADGQTPIAVADFVAKFTGKAVVREDSPAVEVADAPAGFSGPLSVAPAFLNTESVTFTGLRLMPEADSAPVLAFLSGSGPLVLGRSSKEADFVAQFFPRSSINDARTWMISRRHLEIYRGDEGLLRLADVGSQNASLMEDSQAVGTREIRPPFSLLLAGEYAVQVKDYPTSYSGGREFVDPSVIPGDAASDRCGPSLVVRGMEPQILRIETAWLTSDVDLIRDSGGTIRFGSSNSGLAVGRVHHWRDKFWIERSSADIKIGVDALDLSHHELAPLRNGRKLNLNGVCYTVEAFVRTQGQSVS